MQIQKQNIMSSNSKVILALLGGAAIGAVLGILFAPDKGSETRHKIVDKAKGFGEKARHKFAEGFQKVKNVKNRVEEEAEELI